MNCISLGQHSTTGPTSLLTHSDKVNALQLALGNYRNHSDIFLPDDIFYREIKNAKDIERMADTIFKWLKIKHKSMSFRIDSIQEVPLVFTKIQGHSTATIGQNVMNDPFYCAAIIAHAIIHHLLIGRHKLILQSSDENELLTDLGTIYAGLGIIMINGLDSHPSPLGVMAKNNYISEFLDYTNDHQIVPSLWQPYVLPESIKQFVDIESITKRPNFISKLQNNRRALKLKYIVFAGLIIAIALSSVVYAISKPGYSTLELAERHDSINILKTQYSHCQETVKYKLSHWDTSDIFIQRQIDADKTRCESIKSRYDYELGEYRSKSRL